MNRSYGCARWLLAAGWIVVSWAAHAQETSMTLDQALARARQRAPRVLAAQDQVREARGRLTGASVLLQENPWFRVIRREVAAGVTLGAILGAIGISRIILWHSLRGTYGPHYLVVALTIGCSLVGVVLFGTTQARCYRSYFAAAGLIQQVHLLLLSRRWLMLPD